MNSDFSENAAVLADAGVVDSAITDMARAVVDECSSLEKLAFVGIHTRGVPLAKRLRERVCSLGEGLDIPPVGQLDISFHRDDVGQGIHLPKTTEIPFDIAGLHIVMVDDVISTGRTIRAALNALLDYGRAGAIRLAVLVDRGGRELPVQPDFTGVKDLQVPDQQGRIKVRLQEVDGQDRIVFREDGQA